MKMFSSMIEMSVIGLFSVLFAAYAVFVYPFEKINGLTNSAVRENQLKYAPNLTKA